MSKAREENKQTLIQYYFILIPILLRSFMQINSRSFIAIHSRIPTCTLIRILEHTWGGQVEIRRSYDKLIQHLNISNSTKSRKLIEQ